MVSAAMREFRRRRKQWKETGRRVGLTARGREKNMVSFVEKVIDQSSLRFESEKTKRQRHRSSRPPSALGFIAISVLCR
ncbi:hypothetical protein F2Q70_00045360 [Brassica cretica]|uniref:Uncharacterized protein n=1 Tax=Brassica cretica TaxID=69181 RepID=A0A8S9KFZ6_BRACR|nr:hypothetical protein F2Q70_00045360 [Brassica cretica]